jgi:hypothetical protein
VDYLTLKLTAGVIATFGLYSVLYRENKFYRFFEHMFLGLAAGFMIVALWTETLKESWWDKMVGEGGKAATDAGIYGHWVWAIVLPMGIAGYFVFSRRHAWMSRIPIGIILGLWSGQQVQVWFKRYGPQIADSIKPIFPTTWDSLTVPYAQNLPKDQADLIAHNVYASQALTNLIFVLTLLSVLSYFLFSFDVKNRAVRGFTTMGRYLLMIGFGAIFGSTVMMRFTLLIDRMYFIWIEWLQHAVLHIK